MPHFIDGYPYEPLDNKTFWSLVKQHHRLCGHLEHQQRFYSEAERATFKIRENPETSYSLQLGIIPKIKAGFVITGLELDDRFGPPVKLAYYFSAGRRKLIDVRSGQATPDEAIKKLMT